MPRLSVQTAHLPKFCRAGLDFTRTPRTVVVDDEVAKRLRDEPALRVREITDAEAEALTAGVADVAGTIPEAVALELAVLRDENAQLRAELGAWRKLAEDAGLELAAPEAERPEPPHDPDRIRSGRKGRS